MRIKQRTNVRLKYLTASILKAIRIDGENIVATRRSCFVTILCSDSRWRQKKNKYKFFIRPNRGRRFLCAVIDTFQLPLCPSERLNFSSAKFATGFTSTKSKYIATLGTAAVNLRCVSRFVFWNMTVPVGHLHADDLPCGLISVYNFIEVSSKIHTANVTYEVLKSVFKNSDLKLVDARGLKNYTRGGGERGKMPFINLWNITKNKLV